MVYTEQPLGYRLQSPEASAGQGVVIMRNGVGVVRGAFVALAAAAALTLSGCAGFSPEGVGDLLNEAQRSLDDFAEENPEFQEMFDEFEKAVDREAAEEEVATWETRPAPPPYTPLSHELDVNEHRGIEHATYPKEAYQDIVEHYADVLDADLEAQGGPGENITSFDDGELTYVFVDNTHADDVYVEVRYPAP